MLANEEDIPLLMSIDSSVAWANFIAHENYEVHRVGRAAVIVQLGNVSVVQRLVFTHEKDCRSLLRYLKRKTGFFIPVSDGDFITEALLPHGCQSIYSQDGKDFYKL